MAVERFVDFISASLWISEQQLRDEKCPNIPPVKFYNRGYLMSSGARVYYGNPKSKKAHFVASGEVCQYFRDCDKLDAQTIEWLFSRGAEISRLDLAVTEWNTFTGLLGVQDVEGWFKSGLVDSPLVLGGCREIVEILPNGNHAQTLYIGDMEKRGKKGIFRAYDTGFKQGLGLNMATRLELELKGKSANMTAKRIAESNDIAGNFRSKFNVRAKQFEALMDADAVDVSRGKAKERREENEALDKRWDWLIRQVAPSLQSAIEADRRSGRGDDRLINFLVAAGLFDDLRQGIVANANKLHDNYLRSIGVENGRFSSEDLD